MRRWGEAHHRGAEQGVEAHEGGEAHPQHGGAEPSAGSDQHKYIICHEHADVDQLHEDVHCQQSEAAPPPEGPRFARPASSRTGSFLSSFFGWRRAGFQADLTSARAS